MTAADTRPIAIKIGQVTPDAINAWTEYQETGLHVTGDEVIAWLGTWGEESEKTAPLCHK